MSSVDENNNVLEYYGVIEDIIKITWEGSMHLELVLFDCHWFDPTPNGVRRTENLGLIEVNHTSRLSNFDPFVMASQVTQVYYLPYPCKTRLDLLEWSVVYHVAPQGYIPLNNSNGDLTPPEGPTQQMEFYQEDGLHGTFVIDLGDDFEITPPLILDEITNPKDLEFLEQQNVNP